VEDSITAAKARVRASAPHLPIAHSSPRTLSAPERQPEESAPLWARVVADPGYTPEHLAREAVRRVGPDAADWVARVRHRYPDAAPQAIARLAAAEAIRTTRRVGAGGGAAGLLGTAASAGPLARTQARLVLTIAAAYGVDPTEDTRAREILDLVHAPRLTQPTADAVRNAGRLAAAVAVRRLATRATPLGAAIVGAVQSGRSTERLAARAMAHYTPRS
jgi:hypothetical protein